MNPSRRGFLAGVAAAGALGAAGQAAQPEAPMDGALPPEVQMQLMRPEQLEAAARAFPAVYVPFGLIEWHGKHLPLGNDAIKAHGILVRAAVRFGGIVYPPVFFHDGFGQDIMLPVLTRLFQGLRQTGFRVILGVSGHNVQGQLDMIDAALKPATADGQCAGAALWEFPVPWMAGTGGDHAAKWETSNMMYLYPDLADLSRLGTGPLAPDMKPPDGIGGDDPRTTASAEVGRTNVELCAEMVVGRARELLASLPEEHRGFSLEGIVPPHWWCV